MSPGPAPSRRAVLAAVPLLGAAACTESARPVPQPAPSVDPDVALRAQAVTAETALLQQYDAALAAATSPAPVLVAVRAEHAEHLRALGAEPPPAPAPAVPPGTPTGTPTGPPTPGRPPAAPLATLAAAERTTAAAHAAAVPRAGRGLAQLLATLAAAEASHAVVLR